MIALSLGISAKDQLARFDCVQPRYNLLYRDIEAELMPLCRDQGIGIIAYNPLAGGFLTGRYQSLEAPPPEKTRFSIGKTGDLYRERYWQQAQLEAVQHLQKYFQGRGKPLLQASIAWVLAQPGMTSAIVGASKPEQLDASLASVQMKLDADELAECNRAWYHLPRPMVAPK
jgi:aryl-alcohol dehydrogenase-like predicted oxidoreductase